MDVILYLLYTIFILCGIYTYIVIIGRIYWMRKGMMVIDPNIHRKYKKLGLLQYIAKLYELGKSKDLRHLGDYEFLTPIYEPVDLDIIKSILYNDFEHFTDRPFYSNAVVDPLTGNLFQLKGNVWLSSRKKLTPAFSTGKIKLMFQTIFECTNNLKDILQDYSVTGDPVNIREILSRFLVDVIGTCGFGLECNCLKEPDNEFWKQCSRGFVPSKRHKLLLNLSRLVPKWFMTMFNIRTTEKTIEDFFINLVKKTINYRVSKNITRQDFMQVMMEMYNAGSSSNGSETSQTLAYENDVIKEIAVHCSTFLIAGYESSSISLTFTLYELALNQDIQEKLRDEIKGSLEMSNGKITYETLMSMSYLNKVVQESLRKHPPGQVLYRCCTKRYRVPNSHVVLEPGTIVVMSVYGIHRDPEYYPDPDKFIPERFNDDVKARRPTIAFQAFGGGPRNCIGKQFSTMQTKITLVAILSNFKVTVNRRTSNPLKYNPQCLLFCGIEGDIWLNIEKI